jgi:hypothetical protein
MNRPFVVDWHAAEESFRRLIANDQLPLVAPSSSAASAAR